MSPRQIVMFLLIVYLTSTSTALTLLVLGARYNEEGLLGLGILAYILSGLLALGLLRLIHTYERDEDE